MKAYWVEEAIKGTMYCLVFADSVPDAREKFKRGEGRPIDSQIHPAGIRSIRRAPEEDEE